MIVIKFLISLAFLSIVACTSSQAPKGNISNDAQIQRPKVASAPLVGGWYPVFFDKYNDVAVDNIIKSYHDGRVKKAIISYDQNYTLAKQILNKLQML